MASLIIPALDDEPWPTLGPQVVELLEDRSVFGPGDLSGQPYVVSPEYRAVLYRAYEVFPKGHPRAGKRRFRRVGISLRKGLAKTEFAAQVCFAELHPEAPVRCDGFAADGSPVGRPVTDPYIPMVAYTEEQSDELAYGALRHIVLGSEDADLFDVGLDRIMRADGQGKAVSLAGAPNARDGARTTHQLFDESHRMTSLRHVAAHETMLANIPKRPMAEPWTMETTTAFAPGEMSVAEVTHAYATAVAAGDLSDPDLFYLHRAAGDEHDITTDQGLRAAILEASGPVAAAWSDIDGIAALFRRPGADVAYLERVWLNRVKATGRQAYDVGLWDTRAHVGWRPRAGAAVVLGFDGSRWKDATALVGTDMLTGRQWIAGLWENPGGKLGEQWEVPRAMVDVVVRALEQRYDVRRIYADPPQWEEMVASWAGRYQGVREWWTNRLLPMSYAVRAHALAVRSGELTHDGDERLRRHIGNAQRQTLKVLDEDGVPLFVLTKDRPGSLRKIDAAVASVLSWQAFLDELGDGWAEQSPTTGGATLAVR